MAGACLVRIEVERSQDQPMGEPSHIRKDDHQAEDIREAAMVVEGGNPNVSLRNQDQTVSPNAAPVLLPDVLPGLLAVEEQTRSQHDHQVLASSSLKTLPNSIWRERVVVWMYSIADHLRESRSIVSVATSILDRYAAVLASTANGGKAAAAATTMDSLRYEVASMTALFLAVRVAGSGNLSVQQLLAMRRHSKIQSQDIVKVGSDMVKLLSWKRRLVTPAHFLAKFLELIPQNDEVGQSARYLIEMSICDTCLSRSKPSDVALAALMNVLRADAPSSMLEGFVDQVMKITGVDALSDRVSSIRRRLHRLYSLSYDVRRPNLPHVVLESEDVSGSSSDDVAVSNFHSSAAVRTISEDDLCGKWGGEGGEDDEGRTSKRSSDGLSEENVPRLKRVKTGLHLNALG
jgi:Cyclin, C-terminal domain/Cyclin, N-terminal domain